MVFRNRPPVADDETKRLVALLKLAGITRSEDGQLRAGLSRNAGRVDEGALTGA